jgi:hypothetical protein
MYMWRAVDGEGEVLEILQPQRDKAAAMRLLRKLLRRQRFVPTVIVTDKLRSYVAALPARTTTFTPPQVTIAAQDHQVDIYVDCSVSPTHGSDFCIRAPGGFHTTGPQPASWPSHAIVVGVDQVLTRPKKREATWGGLVKTLRNLWIFWSGRRDSNPRPQPWQGLACFS